MNPKGNSTCLHIFLTPCTHESRLLKELQTLSQSGSFDQLVVAALWEEGLQEHQKIADSQSIWRVKLKTRGWPKNLVSQIFKYLEWMGRIVWRMKGQKVTAVHAHSISALPIGMVFKILLGSKLIYDAHELETETGDEHGFRKQLSRWVEKTFLSFADASIVVSDSIADWYAEQYQQTRPVVIRNIPALIQKNHTGNLLRDNLHLTPQDRLFIYQGALSEGRGLRICLDVFSKLPNQHLVCMGYGELSDLVQDYSQKFKNIHFHPAVSPNAVLDYTSNADIGICLIEETCLSHYYSLPNKFLEYLLAGLPVIVSNFPEMSKVVDSLDCGWKISPGSESLSQLVSNLSAAEIQSKQKGATQASKHFSWQHEAERLLQVYRQVLH